ncbi:hypothetical protein H7170_03475 [Candidatus Gracilibacteria bacterium]|nr:hypothetical protein [Candidatus Gracilibacteria bacterium]
MSGGHDAPSHDAHGGGGGGNAMGECLFGYCEPVGGAAHGMTGMFSFIINGLFGSGGGGGHDHGHH